jgi:hypothetical protein
LVEGEAAHPNARPRHLRSNAAAGGEVCVWGHRDPGSGLDADQSSRHTWA